MSKSKPIWAVVPAAGTGSRMQAAKPKQYLLLNDKPVIQHTLERLASHPQIDGIVVAIGANDPDWQNLALDLKCPLVVVEGGEQRAVSVRNALQYLANSELEDAWVLVHDAARPCLRHQDIDKMLSQLSDDELGGILAVPITDTVKRADEQGVIQETVDRQGLWRAATPQMFRLNPLLEVLTAALQQGVMITDEASALEFVGHKPKIVEGHSDNIKITLPQDLDLAALFLQQQAEDI